METRLTGIQQTCTGIFLFGLGMFAIIRGYRAWQNPERSWGLGISWYTSLARSMLPAGDKDRIDKFVASPAVVRTFAFMSMIGGGIAVLTVIAMIILG